MNASSTIIGMAKKFVWVFPNILWKNLNKPNLRHIWQPHLLAYDSENK